MIATGWSKMLSPSSQKGNVEPPDEITDEAVKGFLAGAFRYGSVTILAHMILILPHPFTFASNTSPPQSQAQPQPRQQPRPFSPTSLRTRYLYRPLEGFSNWIAPKARVYQGLTPQFKVFLQIAGMTLGGCVWAERRVAQYIDFMRKVKRVERVQAEQENL